MKWRAYSGWRMLACRAQEKAMVAVTLVLIAVAVSLSGVLERLDHQIFDLGQRFSQSTVLEDVLIVAIDEDSLSRIGRWPWLRDVHARLLNKLCAARPAALGLDIAFSERSSTAADTALAEAIAACGQVVLPVVMETPHAGGQWLESPPLRELAAGAAGLGRVGVRLDSDGIARSVHRREGVGTAAWPLMAEEMLRVAGLDAGAPVPPENDSVRDSTRDAGAGLVRGAAWRLPFVGPPGTIPRISYAQVLEGRVPTALFAGKTVWVGATAVGLGDFLPTPVSGNAQPMPGVEVQANVWQALRSHRLISELPRWQNTLLCAVLALIPLFWLTRLMPLAGLLVSMLWVLLLAVASALQPNLTLHWFAPTGALVAGFFAFPVWSWRRLEAARRHLDQELLQLGSVLAGGSASVVSPEEIRHLDFEQRIAWVQAAQAQMRQLEAQRNEALAFISHDLRTPLAVAVHRLESNPEGDATSLLPYLRRAQTMAQDFLRLARAESLDRRRMRPLDVGGILHQSIDEIYALAQQRGLPVCRLLPDEPVWVNGDFEALERSMINLLQNAVNYATEKSEIRAGLEVGTDSVRVWVDNAARLDPEAAGLLFQRFSRGDGSRVNPAGAGLGLYYVRTVAEKHGGQVGVDISANRVCFWVELPAEAAPAAAPVLPLRPC